MNKTEIIEEGKNIFKTEIDALQAVSNNLGDTFFKIFDAIINTTGKVIITGMGKPGHIATKAAATFSSLGVPSFFLHPAEAQHGDLGMVQPQDLVIAISYSGESTEVTKILPNLKIIGAKIIGITGNSKSTLAKGCDIVEAFPKFEEAGYLKLAPTSSTTVVLAYLDALAVCIAKYRGFDSKDFGLFHPSGALGKKLLLKVKDLMIADKENAIVNTGVTLREAISEMCGKPIGILNILNSDGTLAGIITDGDVRRAIYANMSIESTIVDSIMTKTPVTTFTDVLAVDALSLMVSKKVQSVPVIGKNGLVVGTLQMKDILKEGISI